MHRLVVKYELHMAGPWHIGSGHDKGLVDSAVKMQWTPLPGGGGEYRPVIPGSSIKGRLRTACEEIAALYGLDILDPHNDGPESLPAFVPHQDNPYIIHRLFGSRFAGECLFVSDAVWQGDYYSQLHRQARTGVSMDRITGAAKPRHLYTVESINGGKLAGSVEAYHHPQDLTVTGELPVEYILLLVGLSSLRQVGGKESIGWGKVAAHITSVEYNGRPVAERLWQDPAALQRLQNWEGGAS